MAKAKSACRAACREDDKTYSVYDSNACEWVCRGESLRDLEELVEDYIADNYEGNDEGAEFTVYEDTNLEITFEKTVKVTIS